LAKAIQFLTIDICNWLKFFKRQDASSKLFFHTLDYNGKVTALLSKKQRFDPSEKVSYVLNIPLVVDSESDVSSDEEIETPKEFKDKVPPFRVKATQQRLAKLMNIIDTEAFGKQAAESQQQTERLAVVIGLNRRESLDEKRNRKL
jgi:hypothetical protein